MAEASLWRTVAAGGLSTVLASLPVFLLGGLAVLVREDLAFSEVLLGLAASTFFSVAALAAVGAGRIAARIDACTATVLAAAIAALALTGMATAQSYAVLLLALALGGVANSLAQTGNTARWRASSPGTRQGLAFGVKQAAIPAATLLAGFALPVVGLTLGWPASFGAAATLAVVYVLSAPRPVVHHQPMVRVRQVGDDLGQVEDHERGARDQVGGVDGNAGVVVEAGGEGTDLLQTETAPTTARPLAAPR